MTYDDFTASVRAMGGVQVQDRLSRGAAVYSLGAVDGPDCACNNRPPQLLAYCWTDLDIQGTTHVGTVSVHVVGEAGGVWCEVRIYSIARDEFAEVWPRVRVAAGRAWAAYVAAMGALTPPAHRYTGGE